jgi:hypothetical protein
MGAEFEDGAVIALFEADLCPETSAPRVRFNFSNGWSASIVLRMARRNGCEFSMASLAACPSGEWGNGLTELLGNELSPDEVAEELEAISLREAP